MKKIKTTAFLLAAILSASALGGCAGGGTEIEGGKLEKVTTSDTYPIETDVTLRYWMGLHSLVMASNTSFNTTDVAARLEKETGIKVSFEHPVSGQESVAFNIMQNSDDMPDIIEWQWSTYTGGPQKAVSEGVITPLNDYIDKVSPNLKKILKENPDWDALLKTDEGVYYQYPFIRGDSKLLTYITYAIRKDLLDKANLEAPETLDEWETALYAFKDMGVEVPLSLRITNGMMANVSPFTGVFGIAATFYHDEDNKVKFGPYEEAYGEWIKLMNKWYSDGILDKEFSDTDSKRRSALVTNGRNGAIEGSIGGNFGTWLAAIPKDSEINYVPVSVPVKNKGDVPMWTQKDWPIKDCAAISGTSKNKELAARLLDFGYSEKGHMLYNFGEEGVSYTMEEKDGKTVPTYMDYLRDPEQNNGLSFSQALANQVRAVDSGPFVQDVEYIEQFYDQPMQNEAMEKWDSATLDYKLPTLYLTTEEQKQYNDIMTPIDTYREETVAKLISGKLEMSYLDTYFAELKRMGIEDAIALEQAGYDRYLARTK